MFNDCNPRILGLVVVLTIVSSASTALCQNQDQRINPRGTQKTPETVVSEKDKKTAEQTRIASDLIQEILTQSKTILNPVVRTRIRFVAGDAYWATEPNKAREILSEEFSNVGSMVAPEVDTEGWSTDSQKKIRMYKGTSLEEVKSRLRRQILAVIASRDSALAKQLLAAEKAREKKNTSADQTDEVLLTVVDLAASDPEVAAKIIRESLSNGTNDMVAFLLLKLRQSSPAEASAIFNQLLQTAGESGDFGQLERLVPFVLPTEEERFIGGKQYLTDAQRIKDTLSFLAYASQFLYRRIQTEIPANASADVVRREYFMLSNLQTLYNDLKPENAWLVNARLRQLAALMTQPSQGQTPEGSGYEERLQKLIAAADAVAGEQRDEYLNSAAFMTWRFGQGQLDEAVALADKIDNREMRELSVGTLYFQAGTKSLRTEGPDSALGLAKKIDSPLLRVRLWLAIVNSLNSLRASERAASLREELVSWLRNCARTSDTAWGVLDYLDGSANDDPERKFAALEILVRVLNNPAVEPTDKLPHKTYWYPEFHDFRRSLMPLVRADFDRTLYMTQPLNNKEVRLQVQAALCGDYFKINSQLQKPSASQPTKSNR